MKKFNCTASGGYAYTPRYWYNPWLLVAEMIFFTISAVFILVLDIAEHLMGGRDADTIAIEFTERLYLAYATVPHYLKQIKKP